MSVQAANLMEKIDSVARIKSKLFLPELECSSDNLKYVLWLMMNHKVAQLSIYIMMGYIITNLSFNLLVKEFLKSVNIWRSYWQNAWFCHTRHSSYAFVPKDAELARWIK